MFERSAQRAHELDKNKAASRSSRRFFYHCSKVLDNRQWECRCFTRTGLSSSKNIMAFTSHWNRFFVELVWVSHNHTQSTLLTNSRSKTLRGKWHCYGFLKQTAYILISAEHYKVIKWFISIYRYNANFLIYSGVYHAFYKSKHQDHGFKQPKQRLFDTTQLE